MIHQARTSTRLLLYSKYLFSKGELMEQKSMFVITKSGLTIRPEGIDLMLVFTKYCIRAGRTKLAEYEQEAAQARTIAPEGVPQEESIVADSKRVLSRAEALMTELEEVKRHVLCVYDRNWQDWAEAFRQARIELELAHIEDSPELYALLKIVMRVLKTENHWFSESKFINYINN
jgi:hypothetical protein